MGIVIWARGPDDEHQEHGDPLGLFKWRHSLASMKLEALKTASLPPPTPCSVIPGISRCEKTSEH